jgi:mannosyltransferase
MPRPPSARGWLLAGILVCLLGFAIRLHNLGEDSLWLDEIFTVRIAREGIGEALAPQRDHPPLNYLLTALAIRALGESEFAARVPPLMAGTLALPLLMVLGRSLRQSQAGWWAALLLAVSPLHLKYTQEARHYALLMSVALLSYILLFRALRQPGRRRWLAYGAVTALGLYSHYGALVVVATQLVLLAPWLWQQWRTGRRHLLRGPVEAGLIAVLLYLPWLPQLFLALGANTGTGAIVDTGGAATPADWASVLFSSFGMYYGRRPWLLLALSLLGMLIWLIQGRRRDLVRVLVSLLLPLALIITFPISRGAFARYVIYLLPFYLLLAAVPPAALAGRLAAYGRGPFLVASLAGALAVSLLGWQPVQNEYAFVQEDWRAVITYLEQQAQSGDILVPLSLSFVNGYNLVADSMPYYLERSGHEYRLLSGQGLQPHELAALPEHVPVHAVVLNWGTPAELDTLAFHVQPFRTWLFVISPDEQSGPVAERLVTLYEQLLPLAYTPVPRCLLYQDLAALQVASGAYPPAQESMARAVELCPDAPPGASGAVYTRSLIYAAIYEAMSGELDHLLQQGAGATEMAQRLAHQLLAVDRKHEAALETVTHADLMGRFSAGEATLEQGDAPEAIAVRRFTMPEDGDWDEVIFTHPPASVSFTLALPDDPVLFRSRLGLDPQSRSWGGDGVTFVLRVEDASGKGEELYRQHLTNEPAGYGWHDVEVPLAAYVGQTVTLTLAAEAGPAGRSDGDWAGWASPRLIWQRQPEANESKLTGRFTE